MLSLIKYTELWRKIIVQKVWSIVNWMKLSKTSLIRFSLVKVAQSCPTLCDLMDYTVHGILQARILDWVAFAFSRGSSQPRDWAQVSHIAGRFFTSWATREALCDPLFGDKDARFLLVNRGHLSHDMKLAHETRWLASGGKVCRGRWKWLSCSYHFLKLL